MIKKGKKKYLKEPDKLSQEFGDKVIIIGNSSNVKDSNWGPLIDKFGTVIRTNKFFIKGHEESVGSKSDIWVRANVRHFNRDTDEWKDQIEAFREIVICCAPHVARDESQSELKFFVDLYPKNKVDIISYEVINKYYHDVPWPDEDKWPSTGLTAIQWAIERFGKVYIHGFDFFEPHDYTSPYHYYEDRRAGFGARHIPILEKMCIQKYMCEGKLEFLDEEFQKKLFPDQNWSVDKLMDKEFIYSRRGLTDVISHSFKFGKDGRVYGYKNFKESSWSLHGEYLYIKDVNGNPTSIYRYDSEHDLFRGYVLKNCTKHLLKPKGDMQQHVLTHPNHKKWKGNVIILGNSSLVMDHEYGEEIDNFDRVVRLNRFFTKHYEKNIDYSKYIGKKTNIWIRNELSSFRRDNAVWKDEIKAIDKVVIVAPKSVISNRRNQLKKYWTGVYPKNKVGVIEESTIDNMYFLQSWPSGKWPSTGLMAIEYMLERFDEVHIYGFDFFGYGQDKATHYYNNGETIPDWKKYHIAKLEYEYAMKYVKAGRLILWKDYLKV